MEVCSCPTHNARYDCGWFGCTDTVTELDHDATSLAQTQTNHMLMEVLNQGKLLWVNASTTKKKLVWLDAAIGSASDCQMDSSVNYSVQGQ